MTTPAVAPVVPDVDLTPDAVADGSLAGRPVLVLGLARTGIALARFLHDRGARVTVHDRKHAVDLASAIDALEGRPVALALGPDVDVAALAAAASLICFSPAANPAFPTADADLRAALSPYLDPAAPGADERAPLVSEPDLFLRLCRAPTVGVTGTKGKTTTSSLAAALLAADPVHPATLGGNIGAPLVERALDLGSDDRVVLELSELQLPALSRGTTVAAYTNVTSDHLDRHGSLAAYRAVKRRLAELVDPDGALVLNLDDPVVASYGALGTAPSVLYRLERPTPGGLGVVDGWVVAAGTERLPLAGGGRAATGPAGRIMPVNELAIPGRHNVSNALAAIAVALVFGVAPDAIRRAAAAFRGVEHRLETVAVVDGVRFVNDSQGTQPDAVAAALRSFERPVVLIAGGRDKGVDLTALAPVVADRASAAVLIGESGPRLGSLFRDAGLHRTERAATLEEAVARADAQARAALARGEGRPGALATVLLSPAAASFDMFVDYAARGTAFRAAVADLAARRASGEEPR
jgi:UDP-N-acetylmuramoylalanine--D-glutamate ligase